ncbi:MAG TPA: DMT family transporter [Methylomirabilota bacterium]|jgi:drug/metabolite transporter (DMT)-like permease|nr:DMT family transporter [Methylomirabilota bacterium]
MGILLGLATALSWGSADLFARFATRRIGTFRTMLYMQMCGFCLVTLAMPRLGGWGHLFDGSGWQPWAWGILAGVLNTFSTLALYRSFEIGKLSIVAPISACYPVLTMVLSAFTGERLTPLRLAGMALAIAGVIVVARGEHAPDDAEPADAPASPAKKRLGVSWAIFSAACFGVMFWLLGLRVVPLVGSAPSVWIIRLTSALTTALVMLFAGQSRALPARREMLPLLGVGVLDTCAYVFNNYGMAHEQTSVVSVLASLYGAVTVALAALLLREKVTAFQWLGIIAIFVGIILISR